MDSLKLLIESTKTVGPRSSGGYGPYYDLRPLSLHPIIGPHMARMIWNVAYQWFPDAVAGMGFGGLPWALRVADCNELPALAIRSKPKDYGTRKQIEGVIHPGMCVVVVDDVATTGNSLNNACEILSQQGVFVAGCVAILDRGAKVRAPFRSLLKLENGELSCPTQ